MANEYAFNKRKRFVFHFFVEEFCGFVRRGASAKS